MPTRGLPLSLGSGREGCSTATALARAEIVGLAEGQRVAVDVAQGQKGPEAVRLRLIWKRGVSLA